MNTENGMSKIVPLSDVTDQDALLLIRRNEDGSVTMHMASNDPDQVDATAYLLTTAIITASTKNIELIESEYAALVQMVNEAAEKEESGASDESGV